MNLLNGDDWGDKGTGGVFNFECTILIAQEPPKVLEAHSNVFYEDLVLNFK